jgi:MFS family permease
LEESAVCAGCDGGDGAWADTVLGSPPLIGSDPCTWAPMGACCGRLFWGASCERPEVQKSAVCAGCDDGADAPRLGAAFLGGADGEGGTDTKVHAIVDGENSPTSGSGALLKSGLWASVFDVGGLAGGLIAGFASDRLGARALVSCGLLLTGAPALLSFTHLAGPNREPGSDDTRSTSAGDNVAVIGAMALTGALVGGPYSLITSAVAADLGHHPSLGGDARALATVAGIIDGVGSLGAALQGGAIGALVSSRGWGDAFRAFALSLVLSAACIAPLAAAELRVLRKSGPAGG